MINSKYNPASHITATSIIEIKKNVFTSDDIQLLDKSVILQIKRNSINIFSFNCPVFLPCSKLYMYMHYYHIIMQRR